MTLPPLLYASTHHSADLLYFGRVEVHDPFIAFGAKGLPLGSWKQNRRRSKHF